MRPPRTCLQLHLLLLLAGPGVAWAAVADSFRDCSQFLYMRTPPTGLRGLDLRRICQRYGDKPRYATLYDRARRLPIYSAYTFKKSDGQSRVDTPWMYEPQMASEEEDRNMKMLPPDGELDPLIEESQVVLQDYTDAVMYERGQLNPDQHQADSEDKAATYTLTNVVPLVSSFLDESWAAYLDAVRRRLNNFCRGTSYVVTGVTVSGAMIRRNNVDRLAVPRFLWSAYCCPRFDRNAPYEVRHKLPTYAAYGRNEQVGHGVLELPLRALQTFLNNQTDVDRNLALFHRDCITENTTKRRRKRKRKR
ncbi:endonuclease domain-containing 1 protein-like [Megalops cyprinoides]|uniref:endonuclease domain-containing 1 protein-like n=1 Tax=Megalops cyprinoides TaxID=118141 RepID=UPI00186409A6|nr:endonuclease domain-containing 1 protein-like [Megalops cyprinoides]